MSTENSDNETSSNAAKETASNLMENALALKESNPKVFFGAIGAVVILVLIMMMSGGSKPASKSRITKLEIGQQYTLKSANSVSDSSTVSFVAAPNVAAFDDSEEKGGEKSVCKQQPQGTSVRVLALQGVFAQSEVLSSGQCQGRKGWSLAKDFK